MIDVKVLRKPKAAGTATIRGGIATNGNGYVTGSFMQNAAHAAKADTATYAQKAGFADSAGNAQEADHAKEATHAETAKDLDKDSPVRQEFLSRLNPDTARGRKIFLDGVETGEFVSGVSGAEVDAGGNAEVESARARKDATVGRNAYVGNGLKVGKVMAVSYTHLTLPTT